MAAQIGAFHAAPPHIAAMNLAVLQSSAHQKNAFRFAQFITRAEHQTAFAKRVAILPSSVKRYEDAFVYLALPGKNVCVSVPAAAHLRIGDTLALAPVAARVHYFDEAGQALAV